MLYCLANIALKTSSRYAPGLSLMVNYYPKKRENDTINDIHSDLRHITIAQHLGDGVHVWLVIAYSVALFNYCFAIFSK